MSVIENKLLASRNATGKIITWEITLEEEGGKYYIFVEHGQLNGKKSVTKNKVLRNKSGRRLLDQGLLEFNSQLRDKQKSGYVIIDSIDNIENKISTIKTDIDGDIKPMLAAKFVLGKNKYPKIGQPKFNGIRCTAQYVTKDNGLFGEEMSVKLKSRDGLEFDIPHIQQALVKLYYEYPQYQSLIFDGELYIHDVLLQDIKSQVSKKSTDVRYVLYDIVSNLAQLNRLTLLDEIFDKLCKLKITPIIGKSEHCIIQSDEIALSYMQDCIDAGYEGCMLRDMDAPYQIGTRTRMLQKLKVVKDKEFLLVDIIDSGKDLYEGQPIAMFVCKNDVNDLTFKVTPQASKKERFEYLMYKNRYLGKQITVNFRERTKDKLPFHANGIIRDYE